MVRARAEDFVGAGGLEQENVEPGREGALLLVVAGQGDQADPVPKHLSDAAGHPVAVENRHFDVHHDDIGLRGQSLQQPVQAVVRLLDGVALVLQSLAKGLAGKVVVFDQQDAAGRRHGSLLGAGDRNRLPFSTGRRGG